MRRRTRVRTPASHLTREENQLRDRWIREMTGHHIRRVGGRVIYRVVGHDYITQPWGKMEVVRLRRQNGTELTVGYPEAMKMEVVR